MRDPAGSILAIAADGVDLPALPEHVPRPRLQVSAVWRVRGDV